MRVHYQPGLSDVAGHFEATCDHVDCDLGGFTLGVDGYATLDIRPYVETTRKKRQALTEQEPSCPSH